MLELQKQMEVRIEANKEIKNQEPVYSRQKNVYFSYLPPNQNKIAPRTSQENKDRPKYNNLKSKQISQQKTGNIQTCENKEVNIQKSEQQKGTALKPVKGQICPLNSYRKYSSPNRSMNKFSPNKLVQNSSSQVENEMVEVNRILIQICQQREQFDIGNMYEFKLLNRQQFQKMIKFTNDRLAVKKYLFSQLEHSQKSNTNLMTELGKQIVLKIKELCSKMNLQTKQSEQSFQFKHQKQQLIKLKSVRKFIPNNNVYPFKKRVSSIIKSKQEDPQKQRQQEQLQNLRLKNNSLTKQRRQLQQSKIVKGNAKKRLNKSLYETKELNQIYQFKIQDLKGQIKRKKSTTEKSPIQKLTKLNHQFKFKQQLVKTKGINSMGSISQIKRLKIMKNQIQSITYKLDKQRKINQQLCNKCKKMDGTISELNQELFVRQNNIQQLQKTNSQEIQKYTKKLTVFQIQNKRIQKQNQQLINELKRVSNQMNQQIRIIQAQKYELTQKIIKKSAEVNQLQQKIQLQRIDFTQQYHIKLNQIKYLQAAEKNNKKNQQQLERVIEQFRKNQNQTSIYQQIKQIHLQQQQKWQHTVKILQQTLKSRESQFYQKLTINQNQKYKIQIKYIEELKKNEEIIYKTEQSISEQAMLIKKQETALKQKQILSEQLAIENKELKQQLKFKEDQLQQNKNNLRNYTEAENKNKTNIYNITNSSIQALKIHIQCLKQQINKKQMQLLAGIQEVELKGYVISDLQNCIEHKKLNKKSMELACIRLQRINVGQSSNDPLYSELVQFYDQYEALKFKLSNQNQIQIKLQMLKIINQLMANSNIQINKSNTNLSLKIKQLTSNRQQIQILTKHIQKLSNQNQLLNINKQLIQSENTFIKNHNLQLKAYQQKLQSFIKKQTQTQIQNKQMMFLTQHIDKMKEAEAKYQEQIANIITENQKNINKQREEKHKVNDANVILLQQIKRITNELNNAKSLTNKQKEQLYNIQSKLKQADELIYKLETQINERDQTINSLQEDVTIKKKLQSKIIQLNEQIRQATQAQGVLQYRNEQIQLQLKRSRQNQQNLKQVSEEWQTKLEYMESDLSKANEQVQLLTELKIKLQANIQQTQHLYSNSQTQLQQQKNTIEQMNQKIKSQTQFISEIQQRSSQQFDKIVDSHKIDMKLKKQQIESLKQRIQQIESFSVSKDKQIQQMTDKFAAIQQNNINNYNQQHISKEQFQKLKTEYQILSDCLQLSQKHKKQQQLNYNQQINDLSAKNISLNANIQMTLMQLNYEQEKVKQLQQNNGKLIGDRTELQERLTQQKAKYQSNLQLNVQSIKLLQTQIRILNQANANSDKYDENLIKQIQDLASKVAELQEIASKTEELFERVKIYRHRIKELEEDLKTKQQRTNDLQAEIEENKHRIDSLQQQIQDINHRNYQSTQ